MVFFGTADERGKKPGVEREREKSERQNDERREEEREEEKTERKAALRNFWARRETSLSLRSLAFSRSALCHTPARVLLL